MRVGVRIASPSVSSGANGAGASHESPVLATTLRTSEKPLECTPEEARPMMMSPAAISPRAELLPRADIAAGDIIIGLASSGVHSNGFSLVRKVVAKTGLSWEAPAPFAPELTLGEAILTPTRIYVKSCLAAIRATKAVKGFAHITGGGFPDNIPRVLPKGFGARIDLARVPVLPVFKWLASEGGIAQNEMLRTFNCGIGMIAVVAPNDAAAVADALTRAGETVSTLGEVIRAAQEPRVVYDL